MISPDQVRSFKGSFPKESLLNLLETKSVLNEKTERLIRTFEKEWEETFSGFEKQPVSIEEILAFRQEFSAELYLALQYVLNFDQSAENLLDRILRSIS